MIKGVKILVAIAIILVLAIIGVWVIKPKINNTNNNATEVQPQKHEKTTQTQGLTIVPTMSDEITEDSAWCGTFQLVWNDMKNEVVKQDIVFTPQEKMAENLNEEEFTEDMLSEEYYYKTYGLKTLELKEQIEKGIKEKFDQESDVLDDIDWSEDALDNLNNPNTRRYLFYAMLYRKFEYPKKFDLLDNGKFGTKYNNVKYFGIDGNTENKVGEQIDVLYYNSEEDFAILVNTESGDEVIFCKNPEGTTFNKIYEKMNKKSDEYTGSKSFKEIDEFKAPKIEFNEKRDYEELEGKKFPTADSEYPQGEIIKAIQTIKFALDEKGGEIKSEAVSDMVAENAIILPRSEEPRYFYLDDTFAIFLREEGKELPYFAARIDDITKFQK